jgi:hypothetical protein
LGKLFCEKNKKTLATWQFFSFWPHPEIFIVYVAWPGYDADEYLLPSDQNFFGKLFCEKILALDYFFDEKNSNKSCNS